MEISLNCNPHVSLCQYIFILCQAGVNGTASDEENEDIGEMFALYGGSRRANSQTNLNKLSLYSVSTDIIVFITKYGQGFFVDN